MLRTGAAGLMLVLVLGACAQAPAPVRIVDPASGVVGQPDVPPLPAPLPAFRLAQYRDIPPLPGLKPVPPSPVGTTTVLQVETEALPLADVASTLDVPATANQPAIAPPTASVGYVTVLPGDTVFALSRRYEVAVDDIIAANNLKPPYVLLVGQDLRLPSQRYHTVVAGESLSVIAVRYGQPAEAIIAANDLTPPYGIFIGQRLAILDTAADGTALVASEQPTAPVAEVAVPTVVDMPERGSLQFIWPVEGPLLSSFGPKSDGLQNDGINIAAPAGSPVRASEDGVVAYVGDELRGYGNLILIKHADGWVSAYAHNSEVRVARGQAVTRGQVIAAVGASGGVDLPQSHFELRRDGQAVDPMQYLARL